MAFRNLRDRQSTGPKIRVRGPGGAMCGVQRGQGAGSRGCCPIAEHGGSLRSEAAARPLTHSQQICVASNQLFRRRSGFKMNLPHYFSSLDC